METYQELPGLQTKQRLERRCRTYHRRSLLSFHLFMFIFAIMAVQIHALCRRNTWNTANYIPNYTYHWFLQGIMSQHNK